MRLIEPLVRRETHVAIDAEDAVPGIADQRQPGFAQCRADRGDQLAERSQHFGLVDRLARLEPCRVVVVAQFAEKGERGRPEPGKPGRSLQRPAPPSMPRCVHRLATPRSKWSGTGSRGRPLSPGRGRAGRGGSWRRAIYPRCFLKKAATGSNDALVERFSLST